MTKRRVLSEDLSSGDDYDEASPPPVRQRTSKTSKTSRKSQPAKKRVKVTNDQSDVEEVLAQARPHPFSNHTIASPNPMRAALLTWYAGVHETRGMPWRKPFDASLGRDGRAQRAYEVWISEIMLQQTQVATVIPYYNRWMEKFPTICDLASSDIETVNGLWKGLGYYSRAARLLEGAKKAVNELDGRLPDNAKDMEAKIPGIGRYSAGAICSIAYNQRVPVLDGNVTRLLSRLTAIYASPKIKSTLDVLWAGAAKMVESTDKPGDTNQALIELGSTVCKVREPLCEDCPMQPWCGAYALTNATSVPADSSGNEIPDIEDMCTLCEPLPIPSPVTAFPMKVERKKAREELDIVNVVEWRRNDDPAKRWFLLVRRPEGGLLAGLHEFPTSANVLSSSPTSNANCAHTLLSDLLTSPPAPYSKPHTSGASSGSATQLRIASIKSAGDVVHVFSHIRKTYSVQWVVLEGGGELPVFAPHRPHGTKTRGEGKGKQGKTAVKGTEQVALGAATRWIPVDDVAHANIGTGVLKVWNQARSLWEA